MNKLVLVLVALVGCGGDATLEEKMQGQWGVKLPGAFDCVAGLTLENGRYVGQELCRLRSGAFGTELEGGNYSLDGNILTLGYSDLSSCPSADHSSVSATVKVEGEILTLVFPSGVFAMERIPAGPPSMGVVLQTGCWDNAGGFTPFPVQKP